MAYFDRFFGDPFIALGRLTVASFDMASSFHLTF